MQSMNFIHKILTLLFGVAISVHAVPPVLNYAGQVAVNGEAFDGNGLFKFAFVNANGTTTYWSNDGSSVNGSEPQASVAVSVNGGLYSILLGNTAQQGMGAIDPSVFVQNSNTKLRVWFSDGVNGFQQLSPDRPFASLPYAFNSMTADTANTALAVKAGAITPQMIQSSSITTAQLNEQILKYLKPEITHSPQAPGLIFGGQTVTLHSRAEGKYLNYQWHKNGQPINGATGKRFVIQDVNKSLHDGNYSLVVSNDFGSVTTQPTQLVVDGTPSAHTVASISMDMIFCPPGTFTMGSPTSETGRGVDETQHQVTLTHGFYLGKYEVTQAQYESVMTGNSEGLNAKPSRWPNNIDRPVEMVSWNDAQVFLSLLNDMEENAGRLPAGWKYVLPTEAQWEYACRAGTTTAYSWGNDINSSRANFILSGFSQTRDVGLYDANPWGFFDMHGNVYEWVYDWHAVYASSSQVNPEGPASGSYRVVRGGCWYGGGMEMRSANRHPFIPSEPSLHARLGFRVAFQPMPVDTANPELELFGGAAITREAGQA
jgi:formylglycine-generating enzyme required for sulfatase activity